jgi:hypothetical protein
MGDHHGVKRLFTTSGIRYLVKALISLNIKSICGPVYLSRAMIEVVGVGMRTKISIRRSMETPADNPRSK